MKPITTLALSMATILATSCGLKEKEKISLLQAQKAKDDSIRIAAVNQEKATEALKSALQDSIVFYTAFLGRQQNMLIQSRTSIYTANDEMTQIKSFHLGRLPQTRDAQIRDQELKIQTLIMGQTNLQAAIQRNLDEISRLKAELDGLNE